MYTKPAFARMVNSHRAILLKHYSIVAPGTSTEKIQTLTLHANRHAYVSRRTAPPGRAMSEWVIKNEAPQWACRAAFDLLLTFGWKPITDKDIAVTARYLLLNNHPIDTHWKELLGTWLEIAVTYAK